MQRMVLKTINSDMFLGDLYTNWWIGERIVSIGYHTYPLGNK